MRKWQTTATFMGCTLRGCTEVEDSVVVTFETALPFTEKTRLLYQDMAWSAVFALKPEWEGVDRSANGGTIFLPKGDQWLISPIVRLSHEYQEM